MATIRVKRTTGSSTPTGLTFGEPAYVQGLKSLYIGQTGGDPAIRVGAEVTTDTTFAAASDNKLPSQLAVKTYVDSAITSNTAGVASINGLTGAVFVGAGTAISVAANGTGITVTNTGVQSASAGSGISVSGSTGAITISNTGVTGLVAGTAISLSSSTGNITVTNTGVQSITGTANEIEVSGSTGAVTIGLPNDVTIGNNLTVSGNLTVNGNTTTVNSNVTTVDDPVFLIGTSGGVPIAASDGAKDRGIAFTYFDSVGKTGFFGYDASSGRFTFVPIATLTNEIAGGTLGDAEFTTLYANTSVVLKNGIGSNVLSSAASSSPQTATFPDWSGEVLITGNSNTANYIVKGSAIGAPSWVDPNATGFTAFTSTNVLATSDAADTLAYVAFINAATNTNQGIKYNSGLTYNASTNALSATTFIGALSGNATTATTATDATNVATTSDTADTLAYVTFVNLASNTNQAVKYNSGLTYNASTNALSATTFIGALSGNATTATTLQTARNIGITGDIDGTATLFDGSADINISAQIAAGSIVNTDINAAAGIVDTKLATISTANKVSLSALDIDGGTVTTTIVGADLLIVDDGANGTNRYVTVDNLFGTNSTATVDGGSY